MNLSDGLMERLDEHSDYIRSIHVDSTGPIMHLSVTHNQFWVTRNEKFLIAIAKELGYPYLILFEDATLTGNQMYRVISEDRRSLRDTNKSHGSALIRLAEEYGIPEQLDEGLVLSMVHEEFLVKANEYLKEQEIVRRKVDADISELQNWLITETGKRIGALAPD